MATFELNLAPSGMLLIKFLVLTVLVRVLLVSESPLLCSILYALVRFVHTLTFSDPFLMALGFAGIAFALAWIYFALLQHVESGSLVWWLIALPGIALTLV